MNHVFENYLGVPFVYGETDCCQFVGDCVEAQTGENPAHYFRYASELSANRLLKKYGGLEGIISSVLGEPYHGYEDGDVGIVSNNGRLAAGVMWNGRIVVRTEDDLVDLPAQRAIKVWKVCQP